MANVIKVDFLAETQKIRQGVQQVNSQLGSLGKGLKSAGTALKAFFAGALIVKAAAGIKNLFQSSIKGASDLQQSTGSVETVFGKQAAGIKKVATSAAQSFGLSKNSYQELATVLGAGFKNQGIKDFNGATQESIALGADLAAQFGGSTKQAVEAIGSLMRGEADPIEKYGVSIKESAISAELAAKGQDKLKGAALEQAKAQARLSLLFKQTKDAQGAFAREGDTLAVIQQKNAAATENLKAKLGTVLLPVMTKVQQFIADRVVPALERAVPKVEAFAAKVAEFAKSQGFQDFLAKLGTAFTLVKDALVAVVPQIAAFVGWIINNAGGLASFAVGLGVLAAGLKLVAIQQGIMAAGGFLAFIKTVITSTKAWAAVQAVLNVVMSANPIGLVIIAIAALVAGIIFAWKNSEKFRAVVMAVWNWIKTNVPAAAKAVANAVVAAWNWIKSKSVAVWNAVKGAVVAAWNWIKGKVTAAVNAVRNTVSSVWNRIKSVTLSVGNAIRSAVSSVWNRVKSVVSSAVSNVRSRVSSAWSAVKSLTTSAWNAVVNAVKSKVNAVIAAAKSIKSKVVGALSGAASWLVSAGRNIIQGLINGVKGMVGSLLGSIRDIAGKALSAAKSALGIGSPSKEFAEIGKFIGQGLIVGLEKIDRSVVRSVAGLASNVTDAFQPNLSITPTVDAASLNRTLARVDGQGLQGQTIINVTVQAPVGSSPMDIAKTIQGYLDYGKKNGLRSAA